MTSAATKTRRLTLSSIAAGLVMVFCLAVVGYLFNNSRAQSEHDRILLCQAQNESRTALVAILDLARDLSDEPPTPEGEEFYRRALNLLAPLDCGHLN